MYETLPTLLCSIHKNKAVLKASRTTDEDVVYGVSEALVIKVLDRKYKNRYRWKHLEYGF